MEIKDLQEICERLPGTTVDIKWDTHLCFNVGEKIYLITSPDEVPNTASFKVTDEEFAILCELEGFSPAQYLGRYKWIYIDDIGRLHNKEWKRLIRQSYQLIFSKLPTKIRKKITG